MAAEYVYADNAATTPLSSHALETMKPYLSEIYGNPSGIHRIAQQAQRALQQARADIARQLGATQPDEIYFTSGGSESDNWALRGAVERFWDLHQQGPAPIIITSSIEHHAILHTCEALERRGVKTVYLPVDAEGFVPPQVLDEELLAHEGSVALVSIMLANNEIGTIEPVRELVRIAHAHNVPFHTDAVQAVGHIPVNVNELGVDALSLSAHKFHGPRGVGVLFLRNGFSIPPLIYGGTQERGLRAGTENVAGVVGLATALIDANHNLAERAAMLATKRDRLIRAVLETAPDVRLTGPAIDGLNTNAMELKREREARSAATANMEATHSATGVNSIALMRRLPSIASFMCHNVDGELLVLLLDHDGIAAATGSACATGSTDPSHVLVATGESDPQWLHGSLRLSLADTITDEELDLLCQRVPVTIQRTRNLSGIV